jgi:hypothetical protein
LDNNKATMSRYLELSQATNDLVYSELHPPNRGVPPNTADEDATVEENAREFYRFELALPAVSGMHDQLLHYAKTNISEEPGSKPILDLADQIWCTVEEALKDEARRTGSKVGINSSIIPSITLCNKYRLKKR